MAETSDFVVKIYLKKFCYMFAQDHSDYIHEFPSLHCRDHLHNYKYMKCTYRA
jgi:hypothetical protein